MRKHKRLRGLNRRMRKARQRGSSSVVRSLFDSHVNRHRRRYGW